MTNALTIGEVAQRTGVRPKTIRFYEAQGVLPRPRRTPAGYRLYTTNDVRRLRLLRRARLLGLSLPEAKSFADQAFASTCSDYADQLLTLIAQQHAAIDQRIAELVALRAELDELEVHLRHVRVKARPGQRVAECRLCPLIDEEGAKHP